MINMKEWIKTNINKIVALFIIMQPILDVLTGVCVNTLHWNITIGVVIRILFLAFICMVSLFFFQKKKLWIPYLLIGLYFILYVVGMVLYKDSSLLTEIQNLVRAFYFPILLISLYAIKDQIRISNLTFLTMILFYIVLIFIPTIIGIGYKSYQITKVGTLGFFNSANEISGIISILTPILFVVFYKSKKWIPIVIFTIMYLVVILMVGTKTPLLSLIITSGISVLYLWNFFRKKKQYFYIVSSIGIILVACIGMIIIIPKTNFYKNIKTHLNYLGLEHVTEVFQDKELVDHFIFSSRIKFMKNKAYIYKKSNLYEKLFGIGYINDERETKQIEMDYFDIYYSHGVIGFLLYFILILIVLYQVLDNRKTKGYENGMRLTSIFLIIFLSFFTGHIITAPAVSFIVILLFMSLEKREKKDLFFTGYNLAIGGIEKAQVVLFKNIDFEKYNVTLMLEKKEGEFLEKVNPNVKVREMRVSENKDVLIRKCINFTRKLIFKIFEYDNYDFSCCYTTYSYSGNKLARIASFNNSFYIHSNYGIIYKEKEEFKEFFDTRNVKDFKKLIFVSEEGKESFLKVYPEYKEKSIVMNNFIDVGEVQILSEEEIKEKKPKNKTLLVFVGRLEDASKKVTRAMNLVKEIPGIELWIIGDGPDRNRYEEYVEKNHLQKEIRFLGRKTNPYPYMKLADYIILTSDYEGFPVTYLEAIALEKNIITTIPTSDEYLNMKEYAYIISKDEKEMVKEVKKILKEGKDCKRIDLEKVQELKKLKLEHLFNG